MSRRYQAFAKYNVRDMKGYNEKIKSLGVQTEEGDKLEPMPQIIIIVDELADLMMVAFENRILSIIRCRFPDDYRYERCREASGKRRYAFLSVRISETGQSTGIICYR